MIRVPDRQVVSRWWALPALLGGLAVGIGLGLAVSWGIWPVEYVDVAPASLRPSHREEYLVLVSLAYAYDRDLALARVRLAGLGNPDAAGAEVATLAERYISEGGNPRYIRSLCGLAYDLGHYRAALAAYLSISPTPTPAARPTPTDTPTMPPTNTPTSTPTSTPLPSPTPTTLPAATPTPTTTLQHTPGAPTYEPPPTPTPRPTFTPTSTPTPEPRFVVVEQQRMCADAPPGTLSVYVLDDDGKPLPNVELLVRWNGGEDYFFTGLKPEMGDGYADFAMEKGGEYQVVVVGMNSNVAHIAADRCDNGRAASWRVVFRLRR